MSEAPVTVICFYTPNTPYEQEVIHLQTSCEKFGIPLEVEALPSRGSWEENVAMKAPFILKKFEALDTAILWVDADGAFLQKPDFTQFANCDISVRFMEIFRDNPKYAINAATIFINQTKEAHALIKKWVSECDKLTGAFVDQIALYNVLQENKTASILPLPISYCKIYDIDSFFIDDDKVVIEQRQASRHVRR